MLVILNAGRHVRRSPIEPVPIAATTVHTQNHNIWERALRADNIPSIASTSHALNTPPITVRPANNQTRIVPGPIGSTPDTDDRKHGPNG